MVDTPDHIVDFFLFFCFFEVAVLDSLRLVACLRAPITQTDCSIDVNPMASVLRLGMTMYTVHSRTQGYQKMKMKWAQIKSAGEGD